MHSHARLTYTQVWRLALAARPSRTQKQAALMPHLQALDKLFRVLLKARAKRGAIDFESIETQMIFDDQGKIEDIVPVIRNDAHRLIEECMLAANVCASDFLHENKHPALYRVHEGPTPEKLDALRELPRRIRPRPRRRRRAARQGLRRAAGEDQGPPRRTACCRR